MKNILILFAHPAFEKSRVNRVLVKDLDQVEGVTVHDLYEAYPDLDIDRAFEQKLAERHDVIVFHHPLFWYSCPAILKQWQDFVLTHGWAYGHGGTALKGKWFFNCVTTGASGSFYQVKNDSRRFGLRQLLAPFEQTAIMSGMRYLPPFAVHGTHGLKDDDIARFQRMYHKCLALVRDDQTDGAQFASLEYLNHHPLLSP